MKTGLTQSATQAQDECRQLHGRAFLPDETHVSQARIRTRDLRALLGFYEQILGLSIIRRTDTEIALSGNGKDPAAIVLTETPDAIPHSGGTTGLFHIALRYHSRAALARAYLHLAGSRYTLDGASDHIVSEALYLTDPDGNGIELYADRPRSRWLWRDGQVTMTTRALDLDDLAATAGDFPIGTPASQRVDVGHIHLRVSDLAKAERFYHEFLGLAVTQRAYPGALFFSAGGYHHHIAANIWGSPASAPANSVGLVSYRLTVPVSEILYCLKHRAPLLGYEAEMQGEADVLRLRDPNGDWLEVQAAAGSKSVS